MLDTPDTAPGRGLCLEPHDLVASKLTAGREKDVDFAQALLRERLVGAETLSARIESLPIEGAQRRVLVTWIAAHDAS